jgi:hypothetical protein
MTEATSKKPAAKLVIPESAFDADTITAGSIKTAVKTAFASAAAGELFDAPIANLRGIDGFNVRIATKAYNQHIDELAQSMAANGFLRSKPLTVFAGKDADNADVLFITDGYSRRAAIDIANEKYGADIQNVPVIVQPGSTSVEDLTVALVQANSGRNLQPVEKAIVAKRLEGYGKTNEEIGKHLSCTPRFVDDLLLMAGAPPKIRNAVINEKMAFTEAVKVLRKHGANAGKVVDKAAEKAAAKGKTKATAKDIGEAEGEVEAEGGATAKYKITNTVSSRNGKGKATLTYNLKKGAIIPKDEVKPVLFFQDATWWNYVDANTKADVFVEEDIKITVVIEQAVRDDTLDGLEDEAPAGGEAPALEDGTADDAETENEDEAEAPAEDEASDL